MIEDPRIADVHVLMRKALEWFRGELQRLGTTGVPAPALFITMAPDFVVGMPLLAFKPIADLTLVTCHQVLRQLNPVSYVFVADVRSDEKPPRYGAHCCGGFAGWDAAVGEQYRFNGDEVVVSAVSPIRASTESREYHYTVVPNLVDGIGLPELPRTLQEQVTSIVAGLVDEFLVTANRAKH